MSEFLMIIGLLAYTASGYLGLKVSILTSTLFVPAAFIVKGIEDVEKKKTNIVGGSYHNGSLHSLVDSVSKKQ